MKPPMTEEEFGAIMEEATRKAGFEVEKRSGLILHVIIMGQSTGLYLKRPYLGYCESPWRLNDVVQAHIKALSQIEPIVMPELSERKEDILPLLNQLERLKSLRTEGLTDALYRPFWVGLIVTYVVDAPKHMAYISPDLWRRMNQGQTASVDELHKVAVDNLRKRVKRKDYEINGYGDRTFIVCTAGDGYAATRVLIPDLMTTWAQRIPGRMLIGAPNRDFLIAFGDRNPKHAAIMANQVQKDARRMPRPLSGRLMVWEDGKLREHEPLQ